MATIKATIKQRDKKTAKVNLKDGNYYTDEELDTLTCLIAVMYRVKANQVQMTIVNNNPPINK